MKSLEEMNMFSSDSDGDGISDQDEIIAGVLQMQIQMVMVRWF